MSRKAHPLIERVALTVPEQRQALGLTVTQLAELAGVARSTVSKIESGGHVRPGCLIRVAAVMDTLELRKPPTPTLEDALSAEVVAAFGRAKPFGSAA
jgi:transcriptional regulator with XRE-family HTH domain